MGHSAFITSSARGPWATVHSSLLNGLPNGVHVLSRSWYSNGRTDDHAVRRDYCSAMAYGLLNGMHALSRSWYING